MPRNRRYVTPAILLAALANGLLQLLVTTLELPLFLDTVGTAAVAITFGPVAGTVTGLLSNLASELFQGFPGHLWPFAPVNMATGLALGLIARRYDIRKAQVIAVSVVVVTLLNALLGTIVVTLVFSGITSQSVDYLVTALVLTGRSIFSAAFLARIPINFVDKSIAILVALAIRKALLSRRRQSDEFVAENRRN
ncbi:MAG: ECF transporter S component [Alkalispirochaetaceae bacterium]